jgi:hypothetical protein
MSQEVREVEYTDANQITSMIICYTNIFSFNLLKILDSQIDRLIAVGYVPFGQNEPVLRGLSHLFRFSFIYFYSLYRQTGDVIHCTFDL